MSAHLGRLTRLQWLSCLLIVLVTEQGMSQSRALPVFEHFSVLDGLSSNVVRSIIQDDQGFLWIGTYEGLNKYDGYAFTTYHLDIVDTLHTLVESIGELYEDHRGAIWVGTMGGLISIDPRTDSTTVNCGATFPGQDG